MNQGMRIGRRLVAWGISLVGVMYLSPLLAGQQELVEEWANRKRQISQRIVEKLRAEGKLPQNGTIQFGARVKPTPEGDVTVFIDHLLVSPRSSEEPTQKSLLSSRLGGDPEKTAREFDEIFRPRSPSPYWTTGKIEIVGGAVVSEDIRVHVGGTGGDKSVTAAPSSAVTFGEREDRAEVSDDQAERHSEAGWWTRFWQRFFGKTNEGEKP